VNEGAFDVVDIATGSSGTLNLPTSCAGVVHPA
jgi:hypothetical protein